MRGRHVSRAAIIAGRQVREVKDEDGQLTELVEVLHRGVKYISVVLVAVDDGEDLKIRETDE